ncbi:unnamed protein product [Angiostrongylus costaricensis]|uniref:Uncharacterized protein n=1 Tax=Angiostrongylus costaricensis TaxID=334426 RepID=A0A0R3PV33_ANGCS|nr:unnamed protein product [Angiostrongylus costaricensis]
MPLPSPPIYYCRIRNCQRTCGLVHRDSTKKRLQFSLRSLSLDNVEQVKEPPKKTTTNREHKKRVKRKAPTKDRKILTDTNTSTSTNNGTFDRVSQNKDTKQLETKQQFSTFEEIMDRAARKISAVTIENKPSTSMLSKEEEALAEKRSRIVPSVSVDTTTIHFDNPIWDNPELRAELLDSEEEFALDASPPTLQEDSTVVDEIIDEATHAVDSNPIDHERKDEMVTGWSSDEDDYSTLDLRQIHKLDSSKSLVLPAVSKHFLNEGNYERSIDVVDEI